MNSKKTNYLVAILNIVIITIIIVGELVSKVLGLDGYVYITYNSLLYTYITKLEEIVYIIIGIIFGMFSIVCGIQNRKDKKISFWQIMCGSYYLLLILNICNIFFEVGIVKDTIKESYIWLWVYRIIFGGIPINLSIINCILIRKNKPSKLKIMSYIVVIIVSIMSIIFVEFVSEKKEIIFGIVIVITSIMQIIYVNKQNDEVESKKRKIINIMLYYILLVGIVIVIVCITLYKLVYLQINKKNYINQVETMINQITTLKNNEKTFLPVVKNNKYGFIDTEGKERIKCQYDGVASFENININEKEYCISLAKQGENFYIISKDNQKIQIDSNYIQNIYNYAKAVGAFRLQEIDGFNRVLYMYLSPLKNYNYNQFKTYRNQKEIKLEERNGKYYYKNNNYTMILEAKETETINNQNIPEYYENAMNWRKFFQVQVTKRDGSTTITDEYIPYFDKSYDYVEGEYDDVIIVNNRIKLLGDNCIEFISKDGKMAGFYDEEGNKVSISNDYCIQDVKEKSILIECLEDNKRYILDRTGNVIQTATWITSLDEGYIVWNKNTMNLYDNELNKISDEYDKIIGSQEEQFLMVSMNTYKVR